MNNRSANIISVILLLFVGFVAMTDEPEVIPDENDYKLQEAEEDKASQVFIQNETARWFKSNSGALAIKELKSRIIALRNEYALSIESAYPDEIPIYLEGFYKNDYIIEVRTLYKNAKRNKVQWLFRDADNRTRLISVINESFEEKIITIEPEENENENENSDDNIQEEPIKVTETRKEIIERKTGFIEIYNDESNLIKEYSYNINGDINRIDFEYNENILVSASSYNSKQDAEEKYIKSYTDFYLYNRSLALRAIERVFHVNMIAKDELPAKLPADDIVRISFPRNLRNISNNDMLINERINLYPDFFGEVFVEDESKLVFDIDNRGRILKQTLFNDKEEVVWVITNSWLNNRIVSTEKIEGEITLTAEYKYNTAGDKISEKNYNNGVLERTVIAEGNLEVEELYMNNVVILRAIWEEGIKISETRVK